MCWLWRKTCWSHCVDQYPNSFRTAGTSGGGWGAGCRAQKAGDAYRSAQRPRQRSGDRRKDAAVHSVWRHGKRGQQAWVVSRAVGFIPSGAQATVHPWLRLNPPQPVLCATGWSRPGSHPVSSSAQQRAALPLQTACTPSFSSTSASSSSKGRTSPCQRSCSGPVHGRRLAGPRHCSRTWPPHTKRAASAEAPAARRRCCRRRSRRGRPCSERATSLRRRARRRHAAQAPPASASQACRRRTGGPRRIRGQRACLRP